jgi:hypothetical protein
MIDKDLNTIYDCLLNKTYENRVLFEMTLSNVEDKELVIGLLFSLLINSAGYKSMDGIEPDKMMIMEILSTQVSKGELDLEYVKECYSSFSIRTKEINSKERTKTEFLVEALGSLKDVNNSKDAVEFESIVNKSENKMHLESLKEMLLDSQLYEFVSIVDKYIYEEL